MLMLMLCRCGRANQPLARVVSAFIEARPLTVLRYIANTCYTKAKQYANVALFAYNMLIVEFGDYLWGAELTTGVQLVFSSSVLSRQQYLQQTPQRTWKLRP